MSRHSKLNSTTGGVHTTIAHVYANAAERVGASGFPPETVFTAEDVGKLVKQADDGSYWILETVAPIWTRLALGVPLTLATAAPVAVAKTAAAPGTGTTAARDDHQHDVATAAPGDVGSANVEGAASTLARSDHTHKLPYAAVQLALAAATSSVGVNAQRVVGVADPVNPQDAATKAYVDAVAAGLDPKASVAALSTDLVLPLSGLATTADGVPLDADGLRVLVVGLTAAVDRGIYVVRAGTWERAADMPLGSVAAGAFAFVEGGTLYASSGWVCTSPAGVAVVGLHPLAFTQFSGAGQIEAGAALTKTGNRLDVAVDADGSIVVSADALKVGTLATDGQHGNRGGGLLHALATAAVAGFMSAAHFLKLTALVDYPANWAVTDWYLDQTVGVDTNDGLTVGTPLKTGAELTKRLGAWAQFRQSVTVHVGVNGIADDIVINGQLLNPNTNVTVVGTPTVVGTYPIATYAARNHNLPTGTPTDYQLTATGVAAWTAGQRLVQTDGTNVGVLAFVVADLGSGVAEVTTPGKINTAANLGWGYTNTPFQAGQTVAVQTLPPVRSVTVNLVVPVTSTTSAAPGNYAKRAFELSAVRVTNGVAYRVTGQTINTTWIYGNEITGPLSGDTTVINGSASVFNCLLRVSMLINFQVSNCAFLPAAAGVFSSVVRVNLAGFTYFVGCTVRGLTVWAFPGGDIQFTNVQLWESPLGVIGTFNSLLTFDSVSGRSTVAGSHGIQLQNTTMVKGPATGWNLTGVTGEILLSTAPTYEVTAAQMKPDDWAQSGTATIGATSPGYVDVTGVWYDPAVQRITFGRNTSGGTTGDLSIPQANRTATGFRIQSANVADLSTVDWAIAPLGKAIFYSI